MSAHPSHCMERPANWGGRRKSGVRWSCQVVNSAIGTRGTARASENSISSSCKAFHWLPSGAIFHCARAWRLRGGVDEVAGFVRVILLLLNVITISLGWKKCAVKADANVVEIGKKPSLDSNSSSHRYLSLLLSSSPMPKFDDNFGTNK